jgi:hypothetical protein
MEILAQAQTHLLDANALESLSISVISCRMTRL